MLSTAIGDSPTGAIRHHPGDPVRHHPGDAARRRPVAPARLHAVRPAADRTVGALLHRPLASRLLVLVSGGLLLVLGLLMVLSASSVSSYSSYGSSFTVFTKQLIGVGIGIPVLLVAMRLPVRAIRALAYPLLLGALVALVLVLVPGIGITAYGARRWIDLGPLQVQPSEIAKLALALWGADLLARKQRLLADPKHLLIPLVPVTCLFAFLVMQQPDLGTTGTMLIVVVALLWVVGAPGRLFALLMAGVASIVAVLAVVEPYRLERVVHFLDPQADKLGGGYQATQGLYALGSGGWWGVGLGGSREKWSYLPNAHTDYVFAIIGEELGLLGSLGVLVLFGLLGYAGLRIAARTVDPFARLAAASITAWLVGQALVNIGYVVGLLPVTGVPLPLISYGSTSMVLSMGCIGVLAALARTEPGAQEALDAAAARRRARRHRILHRRAGR